MEEDEIIEMVEKNAGILSELIKEYVEDESRQESLLEFFGGDIAALFLTAPASSRDKYHNSYVGGLFDHSINVFENLLKANDAFELGFNKESMFICALLHDFGKAMSPDMESPHYKEAEAWKKRKLGQSFEYDYDQGYFVNRDRTMFAIQSIGFKLSKEEYAAILLNDGPMCEGNKSYSMKEYNLAYWLHVSDSWAARCENPCVYNVKEEN